MKKHIYMLAAAVLMLTSCSDWLKDDSGDLLIPTKVGEFASILYGEGYPNHLTEDIEWMPLLTDDVEITTSVPTPTTNSTGDDDVFLATGRGAFNWAQDIEYYITNYGNIYQHAYSNIMCANIIIENKDQMEGNQREINALLGEAYMLRSYAYFRLVNWFGEPYNAATADKDKGVAIRLKSEVVRDHPERASVAEVYKRITIDIDSALYYFNDAKPTNNVYRVTKKSAQLLKSRISLYLGDWDNAIKYGQELSEDDYSLYAINAKTNKELSHGSDYFFLNPEVNTEIIWVFGGSGSLYNSYFFNGSTINGAAFSTSQTGPNSLISQYGEGDNRIYAFFMQDDTDNGYRWRYMPYKTASVNYCYTQCFRTTEALLNVAEASVQKGDKQTAIDLINLLHTKRIKRSRVVTLTEADFANDAELLQYVRDERRRELCFEETHRWWDLRRYGCPELTHTFYASKKAAGEKYVLKQNDRNYTLELPKSELNYNSSISPIDRRVIEAE